VLVVRRLKPPFAGEFALPGGHVDAGERTRRTARRELTEETGVEFRGRLRRVGIYRGDERDPRLMLRSTAYVAFVSDEVMTVGGSDASEAEWVDVSRFIDDPEALAFDHAAILRDALRKVDGKSNPYDGALARVAKAADKRNAALLIAVRNALPRYLGSADPILLVAEYEAMKNETVERIKQRDGFINLNVVAAALIVGFAGSDPHKAAAWLALPWTTLCFGWAYLANDEKVSALSAYFRLTVGSQLGPRNLAWERSKKRATNLKTTHKFVQLAVDLLQFVVPTAAAIAAYGAFANNPWRAPMVTLVVAEGLLAVGLAGLFVSHSYLVKRWNISDDEWRRLR
jgi:8-oxo-dGTP diphosphatase